MASVFKRKRTVNGKTVAAKKYTIQYRAANGKVRRVAGYSDKERSWELAKKLEAGEAEARHVQHRNTALSSHVEAYRTHLSSERNTKQHVSQTIYRIERAIAGCGWARASDIDKTELRTWLAQQREAARFGVQTSNYYQGACKAFCAWLVDANRIPANPLAGLKPIPADDDKRVKRRTLDSDQFDRLIKATRIGATFEKLSGHDRALLYCLAVSTGLRASECASLTATSFNLRSQPATVTVDAAYSKNGEQATLPLRADLATALKAWVKGRKSRLWPGTWNKVGAKMMRQDLAAARASWLDEVENDPVELDRRSKSHFLREIDEEGRVFDFHSLRHQFLTDLATAKVHPKIAQQLARHSTVSLTLDRYTHAHQNELVEAVESLPQLTQNLTQAPDFSCPEAAQVGTKSLPKNGQLKTPNPLETNEFGVDWHKLTQVDRAGIEPATHGFSVRCSTN